MVKSIQPELAEKAEVSVRFIEWKPKEINTKAPHFCEAFGKRSGRDSNPRPRA